MPDGFTIPRHSRLKTKPVGDVTCRYRTGYAVTLWPLKVAEARFDRVAAWIRSVDPSLAPAPLAAA